MDRHRVPEPTRQNAFIRVPWKLRLGKGWISEIEFQPSLVITVCDRAHEELSPAATWWHWSTPDPVDEATPEAFDGALTALRDRIQTLGRTR